jgi:peptidyl-dipeptidase A
MRYTRKAAVVRSAAALCGASLATGAGGGAALTAEDARKFLGEAQSKLLTLAVAGQRANWVQQTYITEDTERLAADANRDLSAATVDLALNSQKFDRIALPADTQRQLELLRLSIDFPAPRDPKLTQELSDIAASLESYYGKGRWCPQGPRAKCLQLPDLERILAASRDPKELADAWAGWHAIGRPMRERLARQVEIANQGARDLGYRDLGAYWRAKCDMPPDDFARELDRLWTQVRPFYDSLHAYVRARPGPGSGGGSSHARSRAHDLRTRRRLSGG